MNGKDVLKEFDYDKNLFLIKIQKVENDIKTLEAGIENYKRKLVEKKEEKKKYESMTLTQFTKGLKNGKKADGEKADVKTDGKKE